MTLIIFLLNFTIPSDFPINDYYEYLQVRGFAEQNFIKPYRLTFITEEIKNLLISDWQWKAADRHIISYFSKLINKPESFAYQLGMNAHYSIDDRYGAAIDIRTSGRLAKSIGFSQALQISRANIIDSAGPYPWKDLQAYISEGLIIIDPGNISWEIGRRNLNFSWSDNNSLILSSAKEGYDGILMTINGNFYEFHSQFSILDADGNKYITLHRIALKIRNNINIGFTEALLFSGNFEPLYLNPFVPYYLAQWGMRRDDNIMWMFDVRLHIFKSYLSGELLIDDYMYENDPYPDKIGYRLQLKSFIAHPVLFKAVYTMVDKWVYTQRYPQNVYEHKGLPLGFPLGNDVDQLSIVIKYFTDCFIHPSLSIDLVRKGEGSLFLPYEEEGGTWQPPFPSGNVEEQLKVFAGTDINAFRTFFLRSEIGIQWTDNLDHYPGLDRSELIFAAKVWLFF